MKFWGKRGALGEGAVIGGLTALGAGLHSVGIPKDSIVKYETALKGIAPQVRLEPRMSTRFWQR